MTKKCTCVFCLGGGLGNAAPRLGNGFGNATPRLGNHFRPGGVCAKFRELPGGCPGAAGSCGSLGVLKKRLGNA